MSTKLGYRDVGQTSEEGLSRLFSQFIERDGVINDDDLKVVAAGTPDNTVKVSVGDIAIGTNSPYTTTLPSYFYHGWVTSVESLTIGANSSGNPRIDVVVAYVDLSVQSAASADNPNALKVKAVAGTPAATPSAATDSDIQTSVGSGNPWVLLAYVEVANGFSVITNANIVDKRPYADTPVRRSKIETLDFVSSGLIVTQTSGLVGAISAGTAMIGGKVVFKPLIAKTFLASRDTYIDMPATAKPTATDDYVYNDVANGAAAPALASGHLRIARIITNGSAITAIVQTGHSTGVSPAFFGFDSLGNPIYPTSPSRRLLGYMEVVTGVSNNTLSYIDLPNSSVTFKTPANCYAVKVKSEFIISSDTGGANTLIAIRDSSNNLIIERHWGTIDNSLNHLFTAHLNRKVQVSPNTSYTYKISIASQGVGGFRVINQGDVSATPSILLIERAN